MTPPLTVFVVDDDPRVLKALRHLLQASGYVVEASASAEHFLQHYDPDRPGCVICDIAMPGLDGHALQRTLKASGCQRPIIFLTGHGSISGSVQAIKEGAEHYFTKPVKEKDLLVVVHSAIERDAQYRKVRQRCRSLTKRERAVLKRVAEGRLNKQIAAEFGVTERTIKFHRANLTRKIGITSPAKLSQFAAEAGLIAEHLGHRGSATPPGTE
ncbi:MAG: hypothetical protein JWM32_424 [Verrucomicrobia bacterium]|nr:hypothetical protein [Verrucomicrobiota bacterium]